MSRGKVRVFPAILAGYQFLFQNLGRIFHIAWLPGLLIVLVGIYMQQFAPQGEVSGLSNEQAKAYIVDMLKTMLGASLFELAMTLVVVVGLYRMALYGEMPRGPGYLRFGMTELRVAGIWFLVVSTLYITFMAIAYGLVFMISGYLGIVSFDGMASAPGSVGFAAWLYHFVNSSDGATFLVYYIFAGMLVFLWVYSRLFLAMPAAVDRQASALTDVWRMTKGNGLRMVVYVCMLLITLIAFLIVMNQVLIMAQAAASAILIAIFDSEAIEALKVVTEDPSKLVAGMSLLNAIIVLAFIQVILFTFTMALWAIVVGSAAHAYRDIMGLNGAVSADEEDLGLNPAVAHDGDVDGEFGALEEDRQAVLAHEEELRIRRRQRRRRRGR